MYILATTPFTPWPLRAFGVLFLPMVSAWACISETVRCRKLILVGTLDRGVGVQCYGVTLI